MARKPVIASRRGPSEEAALRTAWAMNHVTTAAPNAAAAPSVTGRRFAAWAPRKLAVTAAKINTASRPSRKTIMPVLKTIVPRLWWWVTSVGSTGPVFAVAIRYTMPTTMAAAAAQKRARRGRGFLTVAVGIV